MRRGKACAPSWSDIDFDFDFDFDRATVTVDESVKAAEGGRRAGRQKVALDHLTLSSLLALRLV